MVFQYQDSIDAILDKGRELGRTVSSIKLYHTPVHKLRLNAAYFV